MAVILNYIITAWRSVSVNVDCLVFSCACGSKMNGKGPRICG